MPSKLPFASGKVSTLLNNWRPGMNILNSQWLLITIVVYISLLSLRQVIGVFVDLVTLGF